jgi:hypothetical protein
MLNQTRLKETTYVKKKSLKIPKGGNQNPYIEEEQTTQWPKEKVQRDKQRSKAMISSETLFEIQDWTIL